MNTKRETSFLQHDVAGGVPIKAWTEGVPVEDKAMEQLTRTASLPIVGPWVAVMPDVHVGIGATVGSVVPTRKAIIPASVGVDIGCGMMAVRTTLRAEDLPDNLANVRHQIERRVPVGRGAHTQKSLPEAATGAWTELSRGYAEIIDRHPKLATGAPIEQLGTLGGGNHFVEVCLDEGGAVWLMLHSGSRGVGNRIGTHFIALAKEDMLARGVTLPDTDLSYFEEGATHFDDYVSAVSWAQRYARANREVMMGEVVAAMRSNRNLRPFEADVMVVNCHHNYVSKEVHAGEEVFVTRKGAVRAGLGDLGLIPGSMGARSYVVRGLGNPESLCSCSHGAGRKMSRTAARKQVTLEDHIAATLGVECRKDERVIDESPAAYKSIEDVMHAQRDLVEIVHTLKQVVCVKG